MKKSMVIGANGQIGTDLVSGLAQRFGVENVIATDIRDGNHGEVIFESLDILDSENLERLIKKHNVGTVYLLAALLSATAEQKPMAAWKLNMDGLFNVLELAKAGTIEKIFWPSSIAVFGPTTPRDNTPQTTVMEPTTVYGISKLAGERWCEYYFKKYGIDVRSIRYPGLISYKAEPGGGTTDYAVDIYYKALQQGNYDCYLENDSYLPMMYMEDAIKATIDLMQANIEKIKIRSSYNLAGISFSPVEISKEIKKHIPDFNITYTPDFRQAIANSWPKSINDSEANKDWGWENSYDLESMTIEMLSGLKKKLG
ncbi:NAD-dependent epimerase/dehydratase family protein [Flavobacteriales bacterium]|nr:NAD-dependent epimerase/dehydratase family protein [Flavobacteriales bacterium]MDA9262193.1 NAD-dependent epimerase/dehydratase family protein [bacterium]